MKMKRKLLLSIVPGLLLLSTNPSKGQWERQNSGTNVTLRAVVYIDSSFGIVVGDSGIVLRTTNGGDVWERQSSGTTRTLYAVALLDASTGTAVGDSGVIVRTTDAGANWVHQPSGTTQLLRGVGYRTEGSTPRLQHQTMVLM
jgi:photosystem II stability/assembly factor-like uncharacterized protein